MTSLFSLNVDSHPSGTGIKILWKYSSALPLWFHGMALRHNYVDHCTL